MEFCLNFQSDTIIDYIRQLNQVHKVLGVTIPNGWGNEEGGNQVGSLMLHGAQHYSANFCFR